jgi:predicted GIY-YIG superfamily endonuclease
MFYVYILRSLTFPDKIYIGHTNDLKRRINEHNSGASFHTSKFQPWKIECYLAFACEDKAIAFEQWLKSGNGVVFRNKHLIQV